MEKKCKRLLLLGAGGYSRTIQDIANQMRTYTEVYIFDDDASIEGVRGKLKDFHKYINDETEVYPAFGDNELRIKWLRYVKGIHGRCATIIHPTAYVSPKASVAMGVAILPNAVVNTGCIVEEGVIVNCLAVVDHDCIISQGAHICPGAIVKPCNLIAEKSIIESGTVIKNATFPIR